MASATLRCMHARTSLALVLGAALVALPAAGAEQTIAYYYDREVTAADLEGKTLRELDLMRNTIFARAGHPFRKKWLRDYFTQQPWYKPVKEQDEKKVSALDQKNANFIAKYSADLPKAALESRLKALEKKAGKTPDDEVEVTLLSRALGVRNEAAFSDEQPPSPLDDPALLDKPVKAEALKDLSRRDLRILRNMIYARHGRPFKSPILRDYFERMEWYKADDGYTDSRLTALDRRNIKIVQSVEQQAGGALTDAEHAQENAADFMGAA